MLKAFQYRKNDYNSIPVLLTLLGIEHNQEPVYRTRGIPMNQIIFCKSGQGQLIIDKRKYLIDKNQCFIILKDTPHEYHSISDDDWVVDIVGFNGAIVPVLLRTLKMNSSGAYLLSHTDIPEKHIKELLSLSSKKGKSVNIELSQELFCLLTDLSVLMTSVASEGAFYGNPVITQVIEYIESNYAEDISLDDLAAYIHRTPEYLCKIFRQYTGSTPVNYINGVRLIHAMTMLVEEPSLPVNQIGLKCGFRSPSYFGRVFSRRYQMSPSEYRMNNIM
jgi:AraC-like DNA-binding protein